MRKIVSRVDTSRGLLFLKNRFLFLTLSVFFAGHLFVALLIGKTFAFAPDERSYLFAFENLYAPSFRLENYPGWPSTSESMVRLIHLPALFLKSLGVESLYSLRILAIFYVTITAALILFNLRSVSIGDRLNSVLLLSTPSFFVFTGLGLRESFLYFVLVGTFISLYHVLENNSMRVMSAISLLVFSYALLKSKPYIFFLFLLAFFVSMLIKFILEKKIESRMIFVAIILLANFILSPSTIETFTSQKHVLIGQINPTVTISDDWRAPWVKPKQDSQFGTASGANGSVGVTQLELERIESSNSSLNRILKFFKLNQSGKGVILEDIWGVNRTLTRATLDKPSLVFLSSFTFLLSPLPFVKYDSPFLEILSFELPFWLLTYFLLGRHFYTMARKKEFLTIWNIQLIIFSMGFVVMSALIEENLGTAIRHRGFLTILGLLTLLKFTNSAKRASLK